MKKIASVLLLIICLLSFGGCAKITVERSYNRDSSVTDSVLFELSEIEINNYGYTLDEVKDYIKSVMIENGYDIVLNEGNKILGEKYYETRAEFYEAQGVNSTTDEDVPQDSFFIYHESETGTPFAEILISGNVEEILEESFPDVDESVLENIVYSYKYKTPYESVESNSTVGKYMENGLYVHEWTWNAMQAENARMIIKQTVPNVVGWYGTAIALGIAIVGLGYFLIKEKTKEKRNGRKKAK